MGALLSILSFLLYPLVLPMSTRTTVYFGSSPALVRIQGKKHSEEVNFNTFVETKVPSLFSHFHPAWWLRSGHLQTLNSILADFSGIDKVVYDRKYLRLTDGGTLGLDFTHPPDIPDDTPIVVVLHGLTGGSYEAYVRNILAPACKPVKEGGLGYRGVVVNFRGCAGVPLTSPQLYSAYTTDDLKQALLYIRTRYPKSRLMGLGFSLGANIITRYVAEEGENSRLNSCCALACPWDLEENAICLNYRGPISKYVYSKSLGQNLLRVVENHEKTIRRRWPDHTLATGLDSVRTLGSRPTMLQFDERLTRLVGGYSKPHGPFPLGDVWDYYRFSSSLHVTDDVRVPFLAISAADDPVVQRYPTQAGKNGLFALGLTPIGGHLGWFESDSKFSSSSPFKSLFRTKRWVQKPVLEWLRAVGEDLAYDPDRPAGAEIYEEDGFLKEVGRGHFGCKEIEDAVDDDTTPAGHKGGAVLQGL